jgi:hypothetical protein
MKVKEEDYWYSNSSGEESFMIKGYGNAYTIVLEGGLYSSEKSDPAWEIYRSFPEIDRSRGELVGPDGYYKPVHRVTHPDGDEAIKLAQEWCVNDLESGNWENIRDQTINEAKTIRVMLD